MLLIKMWIHTDKLRITLEALERLDEELNSLNFTSQSVLNESEPTLNNWECLSNSLNCAELKSFHFRYFWKEQDIERYLWEYAEYSLEEYETISDEFHRMSDEGKEDELSVALSFSVAIREGFQIYPIWLGIYKSHPETRHLVYGVAQLLTKLFGAKRVAGEWKHAEEECFLMEDGVVCFDRIFE